MHIHKQTLTTLIFTCALLLFIGWRFMAYLDTTGDHAADRKSIPQKAVMQQAETQRQADLDVLAGQGRIAKGMSMPQVKIALGEPLRTYVDSSPGAFTTIWWYEHSRSKRQIHFGRNNTVVDIK